MSDFYRIEVADKGCEHCKAGTFWTIVYTEPDEDEPIEIGTSWLDEETAQDICDLMNMAYDAGVESKP